MEIFYEKERTSPLEKSWLNRYRKEAKPTLFYERGNNLVEYIRRRNDESEYYSSMIFLDVQFSAMTYNNNPKTTEFTILDRLYSIDWRIECRYLKMVGSTMDGIYKDLDNVQYMIEKKYCLIFDGAYLHEGFIKQLINCILIKNLQDKVWYGSMDDFFTMRAKHITDYINNNNM